MLWGSRFRLIVRDLSSENTSERHSAAVLIRRFFTMQTEYDLAVSDLPYKEEAIDVIAAHLKGIKELRDDGEPFDKVFQKILADGVGVATTVIYKDFQNADLHDAYLGKGIELTGTDFYQANLQEASLRNAKATKVVFKEAILISTVFDGANLAGSNFCGADLTGASFKGADLKDVRFDDQTNTTGCDFSVANNVPQGLVARSETVLATA